ncbi:CHAT domain-containing protein [Streptomyces sp. NPDC051976]|uniref:CHAT domain-containing protein n=1 Tax=Streptomyces sp. NPDC051976 TaxID=3154947 RepID=UPI003412019E
MSREIPPEVPQDPSNGYTSLPGPSYAHPDVVVNITAGAGPMNISMFGPKVPSLKSGIHQAPLKNSGTVIHRKANRLREIWKERFLNHERYQDGMPMEVTPFQKSVDLTAYPEDELLPVIKDLADEGNYLLQQLLDGDHPRLTILRRDLIEALRDENLRVRFNSDVYLPWPMMALASFPEKTDDHFARFLGYRHQIDQTADCYPSVAPVLIAHAQAATSLNVDMQLNTVEGAARVRTLLLSTDLTERTQSDELIRALQSPNVDEDLMYFWCHGSFEGAPQPHLVIRLSDSMGIDGELVNRLRTEARTDGQQGIFRPFVMLNACFAGLVADSVEFEHIGGVFIRSGAEGVLGPQIEIPKLFGAHYAHEFIGRYLAGSSTAGAIVRELARHFAETYRNPLALTYSLHCGLDSRLSLHAGK